jgi:SRSO17 transposase
MGRVARRFPRVEPRRHARALVLGLLADLPQKHCWTIAEHAGQATPDGLQHLLSGAVWDHDAVRDDVRALLVEHLGDPGAVLVLDETGDLNKGSRTVGVQRQDTGTAGKVDNAQVAVYLAYATPAGHGVVDRELYLPQGWVDDPARCQVAGVPDQVGFATKPELARRMLERALEAGVPAGWVTADAVDGNSPALPGWLEAGQVPYVLAVKATEPLLARPGRPRRRRAWPGAPHRTAGCASAPGRAPRAAAGTPGPGWRSTAPARRPGGSAGCWCAAACAPGSWPPTPVPAPPGCRWSPCSGWPGPAGRWRRRLQAGKGLCGLDSHQVRRWRSWYRWVTLAMLAYAFLVVAAATQRARHPPPLGLIPLTCNEVRHLFAALVPARVTDTSHRLRWSAWRRRHQARARACHYRRQANAP